MRPQTKPAFGSINRLKEAAPDKLCHNALTACRCLNRIIPNKNLFLYRLAKHIFITIQASIPTICPQKHPYPHKTTHLQLLSRQKLDSLTTKVLHFTKWGIVNYIT